MPRFFGGRIDGDTAYIEGDDARHLSRSLHAKPGQQLTLSDGNGTDYNCKIREVGQVVALDILSHCPCLSEPRAKIRLYQALPKGDKLEFIIQKAVELGVSEVIPVLTSRCISRPSHKAMDKKLTRLQRIAYEAAKQSGRGVVPKISGLVEFDQAIIRMSECELPILFYEDSPRPIRDVLKPDPGSISIMVGSEGGFSGSEAEFAAKRGIHLAELGRRILRCETAPVAALSVILYHTGEL